jgi:hypothetical protein
MTIDIHQPELEALIKAQMESGAFQSVEDALIHALRQASILDSSSPVASSPSTGAALVSAMQSSPYKEVEIEAPGFQMPVRSVAL